MLVVAVVAVLTLTEVRLEEMVEVGKALRVELEALELLTEVAVAVALEV
jgi:hypothetical protein